ncbi:hypothetical protein JCM3775_004396 [Rhodotorula graminis]|uniref:Uncharacterized protein n=1 Tax=Rhodotorula graminis (strain WP1) TaxID=578459 RepID=A0A194SEJ7_RHOGW|nr:uncharacterized protein RHOBADRAFT_50449 [Rhodotorula graminis WP1]KPV77921.1 hypothetical protein RHOBADRAFT_50449 [Rhodotorula graminis WP1]
MARPHQYLHPTAGPNSSPSASPALSSTSSAASSHFGFRRYASTNSLATSSSTSSPFPSPRPHDLAKSDAAAAAPPRDYFDQQLEAATDGMRPHSGASQYAQPGQYYTHAPPGSTFAQQPRISSRTAPPPGPPTAIFAQPPPPRGYSPAHDARAQHAHQGRQPRPPSQLQQPHKLYRRGDDDQVRPRSTIGPARPSSRVLPGQHYARAPGPPPHLSYGAQVQRAPEPPTSPTWSNRSGLSGTSASTTFTFPAAQSLSLPPTPSSPSFPRGMHAPPPRPRDSTSSPSSSTFPHGMQGPPPRSRASSASPARSSAPRPSPPPPVPAPTALSLGPPFDVADWTSPSLPSVVSPSMYLSWQESPLEKQRGFETVFVDAQARRVVFVAREYRRGEDGVLRRESAGGALAEDGILWPEWHDGLGPSEGAEAGQARNEAEGVEWLLLEVPTAQQRERGSDQLKKVGLVTEQTLFLQQGRKIRWSKFYRRAIFGNAEPLWKGVGGGKYRWVKLKDPSCFQLVDDKTREVVVSVREQVGKPTQLILSALILPSIQPVVLTLLHRAYAIAKKARASDQRVWEEEEVVAW